MPFVRDLHHQGASSGPIERVLNGAGMTTQYRRPWTVMNTIGLLRLDGLIGPSVRQAIRGGFSRQVQKLGIAAAALSRRLESRRIALAYMPLVRQLETLNASVAAISGSLNSCGYMTRGELRRTGSRVRVLITKENATQKLLRMMSNKNTHLQES